jgi:hypothetical protein
MKRIPKAVLCDYCGAPAVLTDDSLVYNRSYGSFVWLCRPCGAWVGVHRNSPHYHPLGRLANAELRAAKIKAHAAFDPLWKAAMQLRGWSQGEARGRAYRWLGRYMGVPPAKCHIGMFDEQQCVQVVEACRARKPIPTEVDR